MYLPLFVSSLYATFEELTTHFASEPFFVPLMILLLNCSIPQKPSVRQNVTCASSHEERLLSKLQSDTRLIAPAVKTCCRWVLLLPNVARSSRTKGTSSLGNGSLNSCSSFVLIFPLHGRLLYTDALQNARDQLAFVRSHDAEPLLNGYTRSELDTNGSPCARISR